MTITLLQGHVLDVLPTLAPESFQCVVTSPPFYGLRKYGGAPQVWLGSSGDAECAHEWGTKAIKRLRGKVGETATTGNTKGPGRIRELDQGVDCLRCGAWRGDWGGEPQADCLAWAKAEPPCPRCYVCHARTAFAAVWRVLRRDGCLMLNLGDSFASGGKGGPWDAGRTRGKNGSVSYAEQSNRGVLPGLKPKDLIGVPWRVALALQADGWTLRNDIVLHKGNVMPESVLDRCTRSHEYLFHLTKAARYYWDGAAIAEPSVSTHGSGNGYARPARLSYDGRGQSAPREPIAGGTRNARTVWAWTHEPSALAHFAAFPTELPRRCIAATTSERGACPVCRAPWRRVTTSHIEHVQRVHNHPKYPTRQFGVMAANRHASGHIPGHKVTATTGWAQSCACPAAEPVPCRVLDICSGSGTTLMVADRMGRDAVGVELLPAYIEMAERRIKDDSPMFADVRTTL